MGNKIHLGVGVIITNNKSDNFYFQQKDESYWIKRYRLKNCFFGGEINKETPLKALERELHEELEKDVADLVYKNAKKLFSLDFINIFGQKWRHHIYESVLTENELNKIARLEVMEGKRGVLINKSKLNSDLFFIETWGMFKQYLNNYSKAFNGNYKITPNLNFNNQI